MENHTRTYQTKSIAQAIADSNGMEHVAVTFESCEHLVGPFLHGTKTAFEIGDLIGPGHPMNHDQDRISNHLYFAALLEPAVWGAELAVARSSRDVARIYVVEPLGDWCFSGT